MSESLLEGLVAGSTTACLVITGLFCCGLPVIGVGISMLALSHEQVYVLLFYQLVFI